jgi:membrane-associated phospholipid phosphatase
MLLWAGIASLAIGLGCFAIDRRAAHWFHDRVHARWFRRIRLTTDYAKGALWLTISLIAIALSWLWMRFVGDAPLAFHIYRGALAYFACLAIGSAILHAIKIVLGRRRPRDEIEHGLYGFRVFHYSPQHDSFPSGHALTITCVAVVLSGAIPELAWLWFALALYLAFTRAVLNSHYLSDVFVGIGIALITSRETLVFLFPELVRPWF